MKAPKALDAVADVVLRYKPKPKSKPARKRQRARHKVKCRPRDHEYETDERGGVCRKCGERAVWVERQLLEK